MKNYENIVYALGDCTSIQDPQIAQYVIRQCKRTAENIVSVIRRNKKEIKRKEI